MNRLRVRNNNGAGPAGDRDQGKERFDETDSAPQRERRLWAHDLSSGIAAFHNLAEYGAPINEDLLARLLREVAANVENHGTSLFLRALSDALDHPGATQRLRFGKAKRGRPSDKTKVERSMALGAFVASRLDLGWKKEAALHLAMDEFAVSRSAAIRAHSAYKIDVPNEHFAVQGALDQLRIRKFRKSRI
jgi:hypothetical protein